MASFRDKIRTRMTRFRNRPDSVEGLTFFDQIPSAPGGASLVSTADHLDELTPMLHGMMQSSVMQQPGAVFLVGLSEEEALRFYPTAQRLVPTEKVGRIAMSPSSAMTLLRVLFGASSLSGHMHELIYLEHAGNEMSKPGPLAMVPPWVKEQLTPSSIYRLLCNPTRADGTVGGALKALLQHPDFNFRMLDSISHADPSKPIPPKDMKLLKDWEKRGQLIAETLGEIIDNPPLPLQLLPAIRSAQEAVTPSVWYIHEDDLPEIAPVLDALALSHGLRQRHHWFVNADALGKASSDGLNALERLSVALWQHRDACMQGYGPALWCSLGTEALPLQGARNYKHRSLQATSMVIGEETAVMNSVINSLGIDPEAFDWETRPGRPGMFYPKGGQFRHWLEHEMAAIREHVIPKPAASSSP